MRNIFIKEILLSGRLLGYEEDVYWKNPFDWEVERIWGIFLLKKSLYLRDWNFNLKIERIRGTFLVKKSL